MTRRVKEEKRESGEEMRREVQGKGSQSRDTDGIQNEERPHRVTPQREIHTPAVFRALTVLSSPVTAGAAATVARGGTEGGLVTVAAVAASAFRNDSWLTLHDEKTGVTVAGGQYYTVN